MQPCVRLQRLGRYSRVPGRDQKGAPLIRERGRVPAAPGRTAGRWSPKGPPRGGIFSSGYRRITRLRAGALDPRSRVPLSSPVSLVRQALPAGRLGPRGRAEVADTGGAGPCLHQPGRWAPAGRPSPAAPAELAMVMPLGTRALHQSPLSGPPRDSHGVPASLPGLHEGEKHTLSKRSGTR